MIEPRLSTIGRAHRRQLGSLDQALLTRMMDENSCLKEPLDAKEVTMNAIVRSAVHSAEAAERHGLGATR